MAFTAQDVLQRVQTILSDGGAIRWPLKELLGWLNDATREIAILKPDATAEIINVAMVQGTKQALPETHHQLLRVTRNVASGRAISPVVRSVIDQMYPLWHDTNALPFGSDVVYLINEPEMQGNFYVVPGNDATGEIEVVASRVPAKIDVPAGELLIESYTAAVPVDDIYMNACTDFVLYRAFSKDMNTPGAANRAQAHFQQFQAALGIKTQTEKSGGTPDAPQSRFSQ
ncbi:hypothetical protein JI664_21440 [Rhodobacter sp. NTK016B]|uniref:phage adaptor protein n=1 Tax=Rhodobacter sp. NTK016B TaxID=2759676 RepID=UPI001A8D90F1|nr:DUF6682 family protein [Rhodobacter sp. NTK016B]MBN8294551.1 hypothetical protein [Rhodobacter sp. NTK016B]